MRSLHYTAALCLSLTLSLAQDPETAKTVPSSADELAAAKKVLEEANDSNTAHRLAFPNPLFRLIAIDDTLKKGGVKVDWTALHEKLAQADLKVDSLKGKAALGFAVGVRLADGSIALMAKSPAKIKDAAQDAQECAQKLGIPRKQISTAASLAKAIADNDWGLAFEEMGWIQQEIVSQVDNKDKDYGMTALVACGAWLQGIRYVSSVVTDNMDAQDLSNSLRGPAVITAISKELEKLPAELRSLPAVKESIAVFQELKPLVTIGREDRIPAEKLKQIHDLATRAVHAGLQ